MPFKLINPVTRNKNDAPTSYKIKAADIILV